MASRTPAAQHRKTLLDDCASIVRPAGFRRRGTRFLRETGDVVHLVQLQSSVQSTPELLRVTVNLGVFSPAVDRALGGAVTAPSEPECHWRERLGFLLPVGKDVWWTVRDADEARDVAAELARAIADVGIPALDRIDSTRSLAALWVRGICPGLTEYQRQRYLGALSAGSIPGTSPA